MFYCSKTGIQEVDLIFPRNDTCTPTDLMPIVFAIQGSPHLDSFITCLLIQQTGEKSPNPTVVSISDVEWASLPNERSAAHFGNSNDTVFQLQSVFNTTTVESTWTFIYNVIFTNCSGISASDYFSDATYFPNMEKSKKVIFTIKNGAPKPGLVAATNQGTCASGNQSFVFEAIDYKNFTKPSTIYGSGYTQCAVLASTIPTASPCAVTLDAAAASNVSSSITLSFCQTPSLSNERRQFARPQRKLEKAWVDTPWT
jgi:hypothetical protein